MQDLTGKVMVITGGGNGIGADIARTCTEMGARAVLVDIDGEAARAMATHISGETLAVTADISCEADTKAAAATVLERFGRIDVLVNNAAYTHIGADLDALSTGLDVWDRTMEVNLRGTLLVSRAMLPAMIEGGGGAVIIMVSRQGIAPPQSALRVSYGVSKAAIIMLTRHMAVAYGKKGIRCNAVAPGTIQTERMLSALSPERIAQSRQNVLTPDLGEPADISNMVAFLASDSGRYITGQTIQIDGGVLSYLHE